MFDSFGIVNWIVLCVFLLATTVAGHFLRGDTSGLRGFFLGSKSIPWWAVAASLIATKMSAVTFISVPGFLFAPEGDLTYLQVTLGFIVGNILMGLIFIGAYYREEVYSPYEFMERRLGTGVSQITRVLFLGGVTLSQGVRLLATALILSVITGFSIPESILIMGVFAVIWAMMGGINTVIWTDLIQWCILVFGAFFVLIWIVGAVPNGIAGILEVADERGKLALLDLSMDPTKTFTLWVGLVGASVFELSQNAIDQVTTQRALCCKNAKEARKAVYASALGAVVIYALAAVGIALVAFYAVNPPDPDVAQALANDPDRVLPTYAVENLPTGLSGLLIACLFAAGITTLDSALTALSQTTTSGFYQRRVRNRTDRHYVNASRAFIIGWAIVLVGVSLLFHNFATEGLLGLALEVPGYVYGAMLGIAFLALWRKGSLPGIAIGVALSVIVVLLLKWLQVSFFWWYPVACLIVIAIALVVPSPRSGVDRRSTTQASNANSEGTELERT